MRQVTATELVRFASAVFIELGISKDAADLAASSLVEANLRGVDSHGIQLLPLYVEQLSAGRMDPKALGHIENERESCIRYDGENGLGQTIAARCSDESVRLARRYGVGMVVARRSNHFGRAAFWGARIAHENCIGIVLSNSSPLAAPWQGREARLGTNPICVAAPGPWLLDMATTAAASGKIVEAILAGRTSIPAGWALDIEGIPTTSATSALKGTLLPLGGDIAGHKGSGLAAAVELLCGVLSGGPIGNQIGSLRSGAYPSGVSQTFLAIDIERFLPMGEFVSRINLFVALLKSSQPAPGFDCVLVAGEPETRIRDQRLSEGVPISARLWTQILRLADRFLVASPRLELQ